VQDEISEMKRKFKIMSHQIEQLKEEIAAKDLALVKEHFDHMKVGASCWTAALTQLHYGHCHCPFHICIVESPKHSASPLGNHTDSRLGRLGMSHELVADTSTVAVGGTNRAV
jgi:hypothetical protein